MKKVSLFFLTFSLLVFLSGCSMLFEDPHRYKIFSTTLERTKDDINPITILLDTKTGKTWYLTSGSYWNPLFIANKRPKTIEDEMINSLSMSYYPEKD